MDKWDEVIWDAEINELESQALDPNSIERFCNIKKQCSGMHFFLEALSNQLRYSKELMRGGEFFAEAKLVGD